MCSLVKKSLEALRESESFEILTSWAWVASLPSRVTFSVSVNFVNEENPSFLEDDMTGTWKVICTQQQYSGASRQPTRYA